MASKITIKRSQTAATPAGLSYGEMAFVQGSGLTANQLYVGISGGSPVWIGAQIGTTGTWTDNAAKTSLATQYAIEERIGAKISATSVSSFNGATGAVTGVSSFNGLTGAVSGVTTSVANIFTAAQTFSAGITVSGSNLNAVNINTTGFISINNSPATLITTTVGNATIFNTVATSLGIGGAATAITMGADTGTINIRNPTIQVGNTVATITTASGTANTLTVSPFGNFVVSPTSTVNVGGTRPSLTVTNTDQGVGTVSVSGGNLYLGVGSLFDGDFTYNNAPVNIVFEGASADANETTLTIAEPTADRTITLPDATGTVALTATSVASFNGFTGGITFAAGTGITFTASAGTITLSTTGGGGGATGATGATGSQGIQGVTGPVGDYVVSFNGLTGAVTGVTVGGANTFTALQTFSAGISASGATFTGNISAPNIVTSFNGATGAVTGASLGANTFTALNSFNAGISASALTVSGTITSTEGITFGSGTTFMAFVPKTAANNGGVWLRDGLFQVGGAVLASGNGSLQYNMNSELLAVYGYQTIDNAAPYQGARTGLTVKGGTGQSVPLFNVTRGGTSAVQVHQDGYLAIPVNTSPAIKIGTHASKNLTLASIEGSGEIVQTGAANSSLNIRQESGGPVSIGDYVGTLNSTYISVNDVDSVININGSVTFNGTLDIGTTALISAPSATALAIKSTVPAGTGVTPTVQIICPSAAFTLTNGTATQPVFNTPQDTITLQAATTYMVEGQYLLQTGTTSHTTSISFVSSGAITVPDFAYTTIASMHSSANASNNTQTTSFFTAIAGGIVAAATTLPNTIISFKGIIRATDAGTLVPNISFSSAPGSTNYCLIGSYLKFYPIGANTIDSVGTAIG